MTEKTPSLGTLSPAAKAAHVRQSFERKVYLLEHWAQNGVPLGQDCPGTEVALRRWHNPTLGVYGWASPNVSSHNGKYGDLRQRADAAMEALSRKKKHKFSGEKEALKLEVLRLTRVNVALCEQIAQHRQKLQLNSAEVVRLQSLVDQKQGEIDRYKARGGVIHDFGVVGRI